MIIKKISRLVFALLLSLPALGLAQIGATETDPLIAETKVLPYIWNPGQGGSIEILMKLPEGFHAYEDQFKLSIVEPAGFKIAPYSIEPLTQWDDKYSKKLRTGIKDQAILKAQIEAPLSFASAYSTMVIELTYQACSDQYCLFPTLKKIQVPIEVHGYAGQTQITQAQTPDVTPQITANTDLFSFENFQKYLSSSLWAGLIFVFFAGIFTSFTPCIFPMIPITLAVLGNNSENRTRLQNFLNSLIYVLGIATTYSILGLIAASSGGLFGASLGNPIVLAVICGIFFLMSLSMYGLFEIQVPAGLRNRFGRGSKKQGALGIYLTGLFAGIVASPCVGPVLVAILTYVASTQNKMLGFFYLFTYAIGLGLIFIVLGLFNQGLKYLPRSGAWMNGAKFILGSLMLSAFYYYLNLLLPERYYDLALGLGLISVSSIYGAFLKPHKSTPFEFLRKGLMQAVLFVGIGHLLISAFDLRPYIRGQMISGQAVSEYKKLNWQPYSPKLLQQAALDGKPVIIDFWADWCAACHELEERTFVDPRVRSAANDFVLLKFDATKDSAELRELKKKYNIQGLPTLIFYGKNGQWIDSLTLTQFENAEKFLNRMKKGSQ